jgi:hypothetical protein
LGINSLRATAIVFIVLLMFCPASGGVSSDLPTGHFEADHVEVPIPWDIVPPDDDVIGETFGPPIGVLGQEKLESILVYSDHGHAVRYEVDDVRLENGRGIAIVSNETFDLPMGVRLMVHVDFMGERYLTFTEYNLHVLDGQDMEEVDQVLIEEGVWWHGNLWNRWSPINPAGELLYVFTRDRTLNLYALMPPNPLKGERDERRSFQSVRLDVMGIPGDQIIGEPIVLNVPLVGNGSVIIVPTDVGIGAVELEVTKTDGYIEDVSIGDKVWFVRYTAMADHWGHEVTPIYGRPISIAKEDPRERQGKDRIFLATAGGHLCSLWRENGTLDWSSDLMPNVGSDKSLMGVWPTFRGNASILHLRKARIRAFERAVSDR